MHYLIKLIVSGENKEDALDKAKSFAADLVEYNEFDWYDFDGRWGKSEAFAVDSEEGKKLIESGMKDTRNEFDRAIEAVRYMVANFTDEQIYEGDMKYNAPETDGIYLSRYMFSVADGRGNSTYVYAEGWGSTGIENEKSLKSAMSYDDAKWVVAVDFHN